MVLSFLSHGTACSMRSFVTVALLFIAGIHARNIELQGTSLTLNGTPYYVPPEAVGTVEAEPSCKSEGPGLVAVTVITADANVLRAKDIEDRFASYLAKDDVYQDAFSNCS